MNGILDKQEKAQKNFGKNLEAVICSSPYFIYKITFIFREGCLIVFHGETDVGGRYVAFVGGLTPDLAMEKAAAFEYLPWREDKGFKHDSK